MKFKQLIFVFMMMAGQGVTVLLALINPLITVPFYYPAGLAIAGFIGTALFFHSLGVLDGRDEREKL